MSSAAKAIPGARAVANGWSWVTDASLFAWDVVRAAFSRRVVTHAGEILRQASLLVTGSALIVLGLVFAMGLIIGIQGSYAAQQIGAPSVAGAFAAIGDLREIAPYAFGYMMSAKVSTGYVAEIGTMKITDEVDALDVMGMDSMTYLCMTRVVAAWLVIPFLFAIAILVCFVGSFISVVVQLGQVSAGGYFELFWKFQSPQDYLFSGLKTMAMSTFVVLVGCYYGYRVRGGPVEVGTATARAMIVNLVGIHFIGIIGSQLFWGGVPRLPIGG